MKTMHYKTYLQTMDTSICNRIKNIGKILQYKLILAMAAAVITTPIAALAAPPPPPTGLCISTPSGSGCAPSIQPPIQPPTQTLSNPQPSSSGNIKWYPGHYLAAWDSRLNFQRATPTGVPTIIKGDPNFKGVLITWFWSELEPVQGQYNFSEIFDHLNEFRKWNPQPILFVSIKTRDFNRITPKAIPAWLGQLNPPGFIIRNDTSQRIVPAFWRDNARNAFKDMLTAMSNAKNPLNGLTMDQDPLFGGITYDESSLGLGPKLANSITDFDKPPVPASKANYVLALKDILMHTKLRFPNSIVFQKLNWIQNSASYMQSLVDFAAANGIGVSGPDFMWPGKQSTAEIAVQNGDYRGVIPLARENQIAGPMRAILGNGHTVESIFNWIVEDPQGPKLNYIFWNKTNLVQAINGRLERKNINYCSPPKKAPNGTTICNDQVWSYNNSAFPDNRQVLKVLQKKNFIINDALPTSLQ